MRQKSLNFLKINRKWLLSGVITLTLGYITMGWNIPTNNQIGTNIFAWHKLTLAPILLITGFILIGISIMIEPEK